MENSPRNNCNIPSASLEKNNFRIISQSKELWKVWKIFWTNLHLWLVLTFWELTPLFWCWMQSWIGLEGRYWGGCWARACRHWRTSDCVWNICDINPFLCQAATPEVSPLQLIVAVTVGLVDLRLSGIIVFSSVLTTNFQLKELWNVVEQGIKQDRNYEVDSGELRSDRSN